VDKQEQKTVSFGNLWFHIEILALATTLSLKIGLLHVQFCSIKIEFIVLFY
jgi:hypothetical protein